MSEKVAHGIASRSFLHPYIWFDIHSLREKSTFTEGDRVVVILEEEYDRLKKSEALFNEALSFPPVE